ncbi:MAG: hydantoinase/oxoprolinase family protein [Armatimonadetes bacterium]|nr:hydantoinase/oxoprolinase family protein [Armatimonadota bacterium]
MRIGIDVGGTFTKAVALDHETFALLGHVQVLTTHTAEEGVARGIVEALRKLLAELGLAPEQVRFIAHGTTQATNALLEGDVAEVGIVALGSGLQAARSRAETQVGDLELAPGKRLRTHHAWAAPAAIGQAVSALREQGAAVIVAAEAFSVDDPAGELLVMSAAREAGLPATGTHELTKLYGLRIRTRTAVVNASILPRMTETANLTAAAVAAAGIAAPLMVMRCDGGVMSLAEVARRPVQTLLSGPAAGVAGALLYERVSSGVFLEVGGTSTDISAVRDGRVVVDYAEVGGHKLYVPSLDVRTVGLAGGSMVRCGGRRVVDVGPRSAHLAGLSYAAFAEPEALAGAAMETIAPRQGDPADYVAVRGAGGRFALTVTCAANALGLVPEDAYARGNADAARAACAALGALLAMTGEQAARAVMDAAVAKVRPVVQALLRQYALDPATTVLVGGGGGAAALVPALAERMGLPHRLAQHHEVISPIGVAVALVREVVERSLNQPTPEDLAAVRQEAVDAAVRSGAAPGGVEVHVEVEAQRNVVRAIATGATELRSRDPGRRELTEEELRRVAAEALGVAEPELVARVGGWAVYRGEKEVRALLGLLHRRRATYRVVDADGVVRLARDELTVWPTTAGRVAERLAEALAAETAYGDAGAVIPELHLLCGPRLIDLSGLQTAEQVNGMVAVELSGVPDDLPAAVLSRRRQ